MKNFVKTKIVYQRVPSECGAACMAMILDSFGKSVPLEKLAAEAGSPEAGYSAAELLRCARKYGLECHGYRRDTEALRKTEMPCAIYWRDGFFVVLEGFKGGNAYINDPDFGRRCITAAEFSEKYAQIVLTFKPTDAFIPDNYHSLFAKRGD